MKPHQSANYVCHVTHVSYALALVLLAACNSESMNAGAVLGDTVSTRRDVQADPIVGGSLYAAIPAIGALTTEGRFFCTATLIGPRKVLTAGHCLHDFSVSGLQFVTGSDANNPDHAYDVASAKVHPNFDMQRIVNDIGVVELAEDASEAPLGVVQSMDSHWIGTELLFVGYGITAGHTQTGAGQKRAVTIPISQVATTTFAYRTAGRNTCNGDSGGPALFKQNDGAYLVAGVTSYGDAYCTSFGVDTRVDSYLDFVGRADDVTEPPPAVDPCHGETFVGRCDNNSVIWCEDQQVHTSACSGRGRVCAFVDSAGYNGCVVGS